MPQEFQVVRCYSCKTFQVQQKKKTNKWICKMCGEKQSLKKVFGEGSGSDCRRHVQEMNRLHGELQLQQQQCDSISETSSCSFDILDSPDNKETVQVKLSSRWSNYIEKDQEEEEEEEENEDEETQYTLDRNVVKKMKSGNKRKRIWMDTKLKGNIYPKPAKFSYLNDYENEVQSYNIVNDFEDEDCTSVNTINEKCCRGNELEGNDCVSRQTGSKRSSCDLLEEHGLRNKPEVSLNRNQQKDFSIQKTDRQMLKHSQSKEPPAMKQEIIKKTTPVSKWSAFVDPEDSGQSDSGSEGDNPDSLVTPGSGAQNLESKDCDNLNTGFQLRLYAKEMTKTAVNTSVYKSTGFRTMTDNKEMTKDIINTDKPPAGFETITADKEILKDTINIGGYEPSTVFQPISSTKEIIKDDRRKRRVNENYEFTEETDGECDTRTTKIKTGFSARQQTTNQTSESEEFNSVREGNVNGLFSSTNHFRRIPYLSSVTHEGNRRSMNNDGDNVVKNIFNVADLSDDDFLI